MRSSMTDSDHCAQNALAECMNGILKQEFLLDADFSSLPQARAAVKEAVYSYNHLRIHGSLGSKTPAEVHYGNDEALEIWANQLLASQLGKAPFLSAAA